MSVFQSLVFDMAMLDGITDPEARARLRAECSSKSATGIDMGFAEAAPASSGRTDSSSTRPPRRER